MIKKIPAFLLLLTILSTVTPVGVNAQATPEEECFDLLAEHAKDNPKFSSLDLSQVQKVNGKDADITSEKFSVETYSDFLNAFNTELPERASDIVYYPNDMDLVPSDYKYKREIHKANRNNSASVINQDGVKTPINMTVKKKGKNYQQVIDGYYVDSKYVSFGRQSRLALPYPSRSPNPGNQNFYPTGRPLKDIREYMMFTHHLSAAKGGDLMSCNLVRVVPRDPYVLQDYHPTDNAIGWDNFGGTRMSESNAISQVLGGGKFRFNEIEYTNTDKSTPSERLLRFYVLNMTYDNKNSFMNSFETSKLFMKAMRDTKNNARSFNSMRIAFAQLVLDSGLGIGE